MSTPVVNAHPDTDLKIVGQIVSAIGLLHVFPSETAVGEFLVPLLRGVPGCQSVRLCFRKLGRPLGGVPGEACPLCARGLDPRAEAGAYACGLVEPGKIRGYPLETAAGFYGHLLLAVESESRYVPYEPFIRNLGNALAMLLENRWQQAAMRANNDRLSLATRAVGMGIWEYDVVNNRLIWDDQMYRLYGITASEFGGAYEVWQKGVHPEDRQRGDEKIQQALRGEKDFETEFRVLWPDGSIHYLSANSIVERDAAGQARRMVGTNRDVTARKPIRIANGHPDGDNRRF